MQILKRAKSPFLLTALENEIRDAILRPGNNRTSLQGLRNHTRQAAAR